MRILVKKLGLNPRSLVRLGTFPMVLGLFAAPVLAEGDYCWKKSETRGVGTIPTEVEPGRVKIGALSYSQCPANTKRVGFDCHSVCPPGMRDDGLFCRATEYGRGAGYVLWQKDKCNRENAQGCEKNGLLWYPKCRDGYTAFGSNICRPNKPQCSALGLNPGIDLSCAKKVVIGDPQPLVCAPGALNDAGLCYPACKPGFDGAGPVCWGKCSTGFVECGAGCASDAKTCAEVTSDQVLSTIDLAVNIATLGRSGGAKAAARSTQQASKISTLVSKAKTTWSKVKNSRQFKVVKDTKEGVEFANNMNNLSNANSTEEQLRALAAFDPTGISQVVSAYGRKICK